MKQGTMTYEMPNMGCLLGVAFQKEYSALEATIKAEGADITAPEYLILRVVMNQEGLQLCEIGEILCKDKGAISRCVSSLVKKGLVVTESISRKCLRIYLSQAGESLKPMILNIAAIRQNELSKIISDDEMKDLRSILLKIIGTDTLLKGS